MTNEEIYEAIQTIENSILLIKKLNKQIKDLEELLVLSETLANESYITGSYKETQMSYDLLKQSYKNKYLNL